MREGRVRNVARLTLGAILCAAATLAAPFATHATGNEPASWAERGTQSAAQQASNQPQNSAESDASREERANFQQFLSGHPIMARELQSNPSLVNDPHYVQNEPDLALYLSHHPDIKAELQKNARDLLQGDAVRNSSASATAPPNRADADLMSQYLGQHRDVDEQLKQNPALIDDESFLAQHQDLKTLLEQHGNVRAQFEQNPSYFTHPEWRSQSGAADENAGSTRAGDETNVAKASAPAANPGARRAASTGDGRVNAAAGGVDAGGVNAVSVQDVARLQQFFEDHAEIGRQLEARPILVTDHKYLDKHKDLRRFFTEHVQLREAFVEDPRYFTRRTGATEGAVSISTQVTNRDLVEMDRFLEKHKDIAKELRTNPVSGMDPRYLAHHKDLRRFFDEHAQVQVEFNHDPRYFMQRENEFQRQDNGRGKH